MREATAAPEILAGLDYEMKYIQRTSSSGSRQVKLKAGDSWRVRFLPITFAQNGQFYARIAKHWNNLKGITCPRHTEEAWGGSPDAYCPVCDLAEHLNSDRNEEVSKFGYKIRASAQWITYCAVFEKSISGANPQQMPLDEVLLPYQFQHYKATWEEFNQFVRAGTRRAKWSVMDYEKGNDFWVTRGAKNKGIRLDKQDSEPIFDLAAPELDAWLDKIESGCKDPIVKMPTEKQQDDFSAKAEEDAEELSKPAARRGSAPSGNRFRGGADAVANEDESTEGDDIQEVASAPARRAPAPAGTPAPAAAAPARRAAPVVAAAPARRVAATVPASVDEQQEEAVQEEAQEEATQEEEVAQEEAVQPAPAPRPRPSATRQSMAAPVPAAPARAAAQAPAVAPRRTTPPPAAPARNGRAATVQESLDPEENIPEENNDQAPPENLADDAGASETPTAVEAPRRGTYGSSLTSKIRSANGAKK
jgi:hypothetical protein